MRALALIPAFNEVATLPLVVSELAEYAPDVDVLVVDDASTDGTGEVLSGLGVRWLELGQHIGLGRAMRAGLRYARMLGYDTVVRLDADGQHPASEIATLLESLRSGDVDAVLGSRFLRPNAYQQGKVRGFVQGLLAMVLSRVTGKPISDPTSGFWAFGPRALHMLGDHYPPGYSEPELLLFLARNRLEVVEVPVTMRARQGGRSTLTPARATVALARAALAVVVVPLRRPVTERNRG